MSSVSISPAIQLIAREMQKISYNDNCGALALALFSQQQDVSQAIQACLPDINAKFTSAKVTPLHLAAMTGNLDAMTQIKEAGADLDPSDKNRFTPLHHAAMAGNKKAVEHLLSLGANPDRLTNMGGSYADLLRFTSPRADLLLHQAHFTAHKTVAHHIEPQCIPNNVRITDEVFANPKTLADFWNFHTHTVPSPQDAIQTTVMKNYAAFKENPPKLSVKPLTALDGEKSCGLFADEPIKAGQIVTEYTGELLTPLKANQVNTEYLWIDYPPVDGMKYRSVAAMANDGFPNVKLFHLTKSADNSKAGMDGLPARKVFVALDDIKAGEQITLNYGSTHDLKLSGAHVELKWNELKNYISTHGWDLSPLLKRAASMTPQEKQDHASLMEKINYLFKTPTTLKRLAEEGLITLQDIQKMKSQIPAIVGYPALVEVEKELVSKNPEGNLPLATVSGVLAGLAAAYIGTRLYPR